MQADLRHLIERHAGTLIVVLLAAGALAVFACAATVLSREAAAAGTTLVGPIGAPQ